MAITGKYIDLSLACLVGMIIYLIFLLCHGNKINSVTNSSTEHCMSPNVKGKRQPLVKLAELLGVLLRTTDVADINDDINWYNTDQIKSSIEYVAKFATVAVNCQTSCWHATSQIAKFMGPTWDLPGFCRPRMDPVLSPWTLLSRTSRHWDISTTFDNE